MKNLKKVLALVVALTMVLGTVAFAGYTDVAEDAAEYTAVSTLSSLNILTGYEDGTFKPDGDITRAEFCAVVCRALGASVSGNAVTGFTDVPSDHWASGYIAYAAGQKIVNGMGDGTFAPDANVTYEQAVKMLVVALGFEPMASQKGGYPTGYMVVANTYEMTKGISGVSQSAPASRGVVAELTYNALDIPMMEQTGFGTQTEYTIQDGTNNKAYKTLLTNLDVDKLEGVVVGTNIIEYNNSVSDKDEVYYEISEVYGDENDSNWEVGDVPSIPVAEGVNAADYFGIASVIYVQEISKNKYEIIAIMPGDDSETVEIALEDLDEDTDENAIVYYPSASSSKTSKYKLDNDVKFYYNYAQVANLDDIIRERDPNGGLKLKDGVDIEITLIENSGDSSYDMVIAKEYKYDRVDTLEADRDRFDGIYYSFSFDFDDDDLSISIVDANGEPMELADFAEGDVVAFISETGNGKVSSQNASWIELINLGESAVTGTVDEVKDDAVYVDGSEYGLATNGIKLGDEGTFYLTQTGKIFDYEKDASVSGNYAYILETGLNSTGFTSAWQAKLLTKNNEIVIYTVRDNFKIDDVTYKEDADNAGILSDLEGVDFKAQVADRVITYKLDSKGYIREISTVNVSGEETGAEYKAATQKLGKTLEDDTVIFNISPSSMTSATAAGISYLVDGGVYDYHIVKNEDNEYDCVVITNGGNLVDYSQNVAIVAGVTDITVDDASTNAKKITYYSNEEEDAKTIIVVDDEDISVPENGENYDDIAVGAIMMFTDNGEGTASAYTILATANNSTSASTDAYTINEAAMEKYLAGANDDENGIIGGYINTWTSRNGGKVLDVVVKDNKGATDIASAAASADLVINNTVNAYTYYNRTSSKVDVKVGDWAAVSSVDVYDADKGDATFFLAFMTEGDVVDFITFSTRKTVN